MAEENGAGSNFIWAFAFIVVIAIIFGALYYSGFLGKAGKTTEKVDVNVSVPR